MPKLMLVEDNQAVRESLCLALEPDFEVTQARNGEEALSRVESEQPDVVLLDHRLEGMSGTQVMERLSARDRRPTVVLFSAALDITLARQAMKLGATDCLPKPTSLGQLREKLRSAAVTPAGQRPRQAPFFLNVARLLSRLAEPENGRERNLEAKVLAFMGGLLREALEVCDGDKTRAADRLGLTDEEFNQLQQRLQWEEKNGICAPASC